MALDPLPDFSTLCARAQSHELFQHSINHITSSPVVQQAAFTAYSRGRSGQSGFHTSRGGRGRSFSTNRGRGGGRRSFTPRCYFCRSTEHDVFDCPRRFDRSFDRSSRPSFHANVAEALSTDNNNSSSSVSD